MRLFTLLLCTGLLLSAGRAAAHELGDPIVVVSDTELTTDDGARLAIPPGTVALVREMQGARLRIAPLLSGWVDAAAVQDLPRAVETFKLALLKNPKDPIALRALGNVYWGLGEWGLAMDYLGRALCLNPEDWLAHQWRARILLDARLCDLALLDTNVLLRLRPDDAAAMYLRGLVNQARGKLAEALVDYEAALKLAPNSAAPWIGYGDVRLEQKDFDAAINNYTKAIEREPHDARAYVGRALAYLAKEMDDQGLADLRKAIEVNPKYASAYHRLACYYLYNRDANRRNVDEALKYARRACELAQWRDASAISTLADAYRISGDNSRAVDLRIAAMRTAMAEGAKVSEWQIQDHFNRCCHCNQDDLHCHCKQPELVPPRKGTTTQTPQPAVVYPIRANQYPPYRPER